MLRAYLPADADLALSGEAGVEPASPRVPPSGAARALLHRGAVT